MFDDLLQPLGIVIIYLAGSYACWRIASVLYDWHTGEFKYWPAQPAPQSAAPARSNDAVASPGPVIPPVENISTAPAATTDSQAAAAVEPALDQSPIDQLIPTDSAAVSSTEAADSDETALSEPSGNDSATELPKTEAQAEVEQTETPAGDPVFEEQQLSESAPTAEVEFTSPLEKSGQAEALAYADTTGGASGTVEFENGANHPPTSTIVLDSVTAGQPAEEMRFTESTEENRAADSIQFAEDEPHSGPSSSQLEFEEAKSASAPAGTSAEYKESDCSAASTVAFLSEQDSTESKSQIRFVEDSLEAECALSDPTFEQTSPEVSPTTARIAGAPEEASERKTIDARAAPPASPRGKARPATLTEFDERAVTSVNRWNDAGESFCILLFAIDKSETEAGLKEEFATGQVGQMLVSKICDVAKNEALVARKGDHIIVLATSTELDEGKRMAERMRRAVARAEFQTETQILQTTLSGGVAAVRGSETIEHVSRRAHEALGEAIEYGRDRIFFHDGERCRAMWRTANVDANVLVGTSAVKPSATFDNPRADLATGPRRDMEGTPDVEAPLDESQLATMEIEFQTEPSRDKRRAPRTPIGRLHPIAPYTGNQKPSDNEYRMMECNDISSSGFSFFARHPPSWSQLVVKILGRSLVATVVHRTRTTNDDPEKRYLVGCYFTGSLESRR